MTDDTTPVDPKTVKTPEAVTTPEAVKTPEAAEASATPPSGARRTGRRNLAIGGGVAVVLATLAAGYSLARPSDVPLTPIPPKPIVSLAPSAGAAIKGRVAEIFGNKFVVQDDSGRALVETGREGEVGLVKTDEGITVQGRFENGFLRATLLTHEDGTTVRLGKKGPGPREPREWAKDKLGLNGAPDVPALTALVAGAGYTDIRVVGRGPKHLEVAAKDKDGREHALHVGFDGDIRDKRMF